MMNLASPNAAAHNAYYAGRNLTDQYNDGTFSKNVSSGRFDNIFPGDYIIKTKIIDGVTYTSHIDIIAELDPYYGKWDGSKYITTHHVGIIPLQHLGLASMNSENITTGGFKSSQMLTTTLPKYLTGYENAYGKNHLLDFAHLITNSVDTEITSPGCSAWKGGSIGWGWIKTKITLMSEVQVYGSRVWGGGYDIGEAYKQLAVFRLNPQLIHFQNGTFWLRAVASSTNFAYSFGYGNAYGTNASHRLFVRPLLLLY